jgi:hypothetical protein
MWVGGVAASMRGGNTHGPKHISSTPGAKMGLGARKVRWVTFPGERLPVRHKGYRGQQLSTMECSEAPPEGSYLSGKLNQLWHS